MPVWESVYVALFMFVIVFAGLFCLYACVRFFSFAVSKLERANKPAQPAP